MDEVIAFCRLEHPRLVGLLSLYCGRPDVAEELAQEAVAVALSRWKDVESATSPSAWISRVAINLANSHFRRKAAERRAQQRLLQTPAETQTEDLDVREAVRAAVSRLPRRQRAALVLRFYADMTVAQAADAMGCSEGTVKALTHQGVSNLQRDRGIFELREVNDAV
jgi:RNA polymerase sigma factor (sigma-70 family)